MLFSFYNTYMNNIDTSIFKAYDIRGIYPSQINEDVVYKTARAYATLLQNENPGKHLTIAVSCDMRLSSPSLKSKTIEGLTNSGINVIDMGMLSTPSFYYGVAKFKYDGGIQISASHNPGNYNGMKMVRSGAVPISKDTGIQTIKDMVISESYHKESAQKGSVAENNQVTETEANDLTSLVNISEIKHFKIVVDAANSMGGVDMEALLNKLPVEFIKMNFNLDGNFPAHGEADPMKPENTQDLCAKVLAEHADLGIAPDGDGDRYFFIDDTGKVVDQSIIRGLMAQIELKQNPEAVVAYDIRPGKVTKDMIDEVQGKSIVTAVGHSLIKEQMIKSSAIFGGESSGHFFYKLDIGTFEVPMLLVLKLLIYISESGKKLSEIIAPYQKYSNTGEINTKVANQEEVKAIIEKIKTQYADGKHNELDGLFIEYPDYWFIVRGSNTEPVIRLIVEAISREVMEQKSEEILNIIKGN